MQDWNEINALFPISDWGVLFVEIGVAHISDGLINNSITTFENHKALRDHVQRRIYHKRAAQCIHMALLPS